MAISKSNHSTPQPYNTPSLSSFPPPESYDPSPGTPSRPPRSSLRSAPAVDVATWTASVSATTGSVSALHVSTPSPSHSLSPHTPGPSGTVVIPIVDNASSRTPVTPSRPLSRPLPAPTVDYTPRSHTPSKKVGNYYHTVQRSRSLIDRASVTRREALLHGNPGTRRRQRWENSRLLNNPWATPPSKEDWAPGREPMRRRETVPYHVAGHWDGRGDPWAEESKRGKPKGHGRKGEGERGRRTRRRGEEEEVVVTSTKEEQLKVGHVPRELRERLKKARGAKVLMRDLEERVRSFLEAHERAATTVPSNVASENAEDEALSTSSDDEIVYVGRIGTGSKSWARATPSTPHTWDPKSSPTQFPHTPSATSTPAADALIHSTPLSDRSASFAGWLVHAIAGYYGLRTWSVTVEGRPSRREAYVGLEEHGRHGLGLEAMPRPLWVVV